MKNKFLTAAAALAILTSMAATPAMAQNRTVISQVGRDNGVAASQQGRGNRVAVDQAGRVNYARRANRQPQLSAHEPRRHAQRSDH